MTKIPGTDYTVYRHACLLTLISECVPAPLHHEKMKEGKVRTGKDFPLLQK